MRPIESLADSRLMSVTRETFPLFACEKRYARDGERARAREPTRGALRRVELKERRPLKKLVLSFPLVDPGTAPGPPVRGSLRARRETFDQILNFAGAARRRVLTKINRRLAWTITVCLADKTDARDSGD